MKTIHKSFLLLILVIVQSHTVFSQENFAKNIRTNATDDEKLFVYYDIDPEVESRYFKVTVSFNFEGTKITPRASNLFGDFGMFIEKGEKLLYWEYGKEFMGDISKVVVNVIAVKQPESVTADFEIVGLQSIVNQPAPVAISFKNNSLNATSYQWNFGDSAAFTAYTSTEVNPTHDYSHAGRYRVNLYAENAEFNLSSSKDLEFLLYQNPEAKKHKTIKIVSAVAAAGFLAVGVTPSIIDEVQYVCLGVAAAGVVMVIVQAKKQKAAQNQLSIQLATIKRGGMVQMTYRF